MLRSASATTSYNVFALPDPQPVIRHSYRLSRFFESSYRVVRYTLGLLAAHPLHNYLKYCGDIGRIHSFPRDISAFLHRPLTTRCLGQCMLVFFFFSHMSILSVYSHFCMFGGFQSGYSSAFGCFALPHFRGPRVNIFLNCI